MNIILHLTKTQMNTDHTLVEKCLLSGSYKLQVGLCSLHNWTFLQPPEQVHISDPEATLVFYMFFVS